MIKQDAALFGIQISSINFKIVFEQTDSQILIELYKIDNKESRSETMEIFDSAKTSKDLEIKARLHSLKLELIDTITASNIDNVNKLIEKIQNLNSLTDLIKFEVLSFNSKPKWDLLLSAYAPIQTKLNDWLVVQAIIHDKKEQKKADNLAKRTDPDNTLIVRKDLLENIEIGQKLWFRIIVNEIEGFNNYQELIWNGKFSSLEFLVKVPENFKSEKIWVSLTVLKDQIPIGNFSFSIKITNISSKFDERQQSEFKPYKNAFVSYSSMDRNEVIKRIQGFEALGINVFQDFKSLKAGEDWEGKLFQKIPESDLFLLFWSSNAQKSKWVEKEWKYALKNQKANPMHAPDIIPILIEGPPPIQPPKQLKHLHFNDPNLYFIGKEG